MGGESGDRMLVGSRPSMRTFGLTRGALVAILARMARIPKLDRRTRFQIAAEVGCDPRSVERVEKGEVLRFLPVEDKIVEVATRVLKKRAKAAESAPAAEGQAGEQKAGA